MTELTPRRPRSQDMSALVGILAVIEGEIRASHASTGELSEWILRVGHRLSSSGLLDREPRPEDLWTAVGNLNQRLRYVLGEYGVEHEGQAL